MARRSPKNPVNDIINTVGGWLGGRGPGTNPQVQAAMQATRAIARTADTATGGFGQALLSDAQRMAMTGSSTPSALYKTAAVNLGAAAAGVGAAKVAGKAASKVVESGVPARVVNKVTGQQVMVHGTPHEIVGGYLSPRAGSIASPTEPVVFGWNPTKELAVNTVNAPLEYSMGSGHVIVGKAPKSAVSLGDTDAILRSTKPVKVVGQVNAPGNFTQYETELRRMLKRAGANIDPGLIQKTKTAVKKAKTKRADKRSPF